jgi:plastocyanin
MAATPRTRLGWQRIAVALAIIGFGLALLGLRGETASAGSAAVASGGATVDIDHFAYTPHTLTIARGGTVTFSNSSRVAHTATHAGSFNTGHIKPGTAVSIRFNQRGTFAYHCLIHPFMHGKIVVK